jgi:hypothetical protein
METTKMWMMGSDSGMVQFADTQGRARGHRAKRTYHIRNQYNRTSVEIKQPALRLMTFSRDRVKEQMGGTPQ